MNYIYYSVIFIIIICLFNYLINKNTLKKKRKKRRSKRNILTVKSIIKKKSKNNSILNFEPIVKKYDKYNVISKTYLKYVNKIDTDDHYLTWRYSGNDFKSNNSYNLILLPYKNKQNEFKIHLMDSLYLKQFYEKYNLHNSISRDQLKKIIFITSEYNCNKEQYLELEITLDNSNIYIIKASLWMNKGPVTYLHIDNKNKLYFEKGINQNVAKFIVE